MNASHDKILELLRHQDGWVSGEALCQELGISRTAVWKQIGRLRSSGYDIRTKRHLGYRFVAGPGVPLEAEVRPLLQTAVIGRTFHFATEVDSTNLWALRRGLEGEAEGAVFVAESQTGGRGRHGSAWFSPPGRNLHVSLLLRPDCHPSAVGELSMLGAQALRQAIEEERSGLDLSVVAPGDLRCGGRKLAGFLCEMLGEPDGVELVVLGMGLLVNVREEELPAAWRGRMSSLREALGREVDRPRLLAAFFSHFETLYRGWQRQMAKSQ
jgi:BirA family biotin operon repressor/biotin-[acetyl-CoA-carboxylase] ligase